MQDYNTHTNIQKILLNNSKILYNANFIKRFQIVTLIKKKNHTKQNLSSWEKYLNASDTGA